MSLFGVIDAPEHHEMPTFRNESVSSLISATTEDLSHRRLLKLNVIRVFGCDESSIGTEFLEPQTPVAEQSPRRKRDLRDEEVAEIDQSQWLRSILFSGNPTGLPVPPSYAAAEDIVDGVPMLSTSSIDYRFMLHQEASYRRFVIQQYDNEFSLIFEKFCDVEDGLRFELHETVSRYWLKSDYEQGARTIAALAHDNIVCINIMTHAAVLSQNEAASRQDVVEEFLAGLDGLDVQEAGDYLQLMKRSGAKADQPPEATTTNEPTPVTQPLAQPPLEPESETTRVAKPPPAKNYAGHRHAQQQRIMAEYLQGQLLTRTASPPKTAAPPGAALSPERASASPHGTLVMSFSTPASVINFILEQEAGRRQRIDTSFSGEFSVLLKRTTQYTLLVKRGLAQHQLMVEESVGRSNVEAEYYYLMLEACTTMEKLRRRDIIIKQQPRTFTSFKYEEKQAWLKARKAESDRYTQEELDGIEKDKDLREALTAWSETRLHKKLSMNRSETGERLALMHDESSQKAVLREQFEQSMSTLQEIQTSFEIEMHRIATTVTWTKLTYDAIYLRESQHRTCLEADQKEGFQRLQAAETSCYLATRRTWLIDETAAEALAPYDEFERQLEAKSTGAVSVSQE